MPEPPPYSYPRYLSAKASVDARARNSSVWARFLDALTEPDASSVQLLEVGGGVGTTVQRIVGALEHRSVPALEYTLVDIEPRNIEAAQETLREWALERGYRVSGWERQVWTDGPVEVSIEFVTADLLELASLRDTAIYDAVVAQAVFDLLPVSEALEALDPLLRPNGLWYLPLHFDGVTAFEPTVDAGLDTRIERLYHESMSEGGQEGGRTGAYCGRRLLTELRSAASTLLRAGGSDWVVCPQNEEYPDEEAYFLHCILHFIETELSGHADLEPEVFDRWVRTRRRQVEDGKLIYIAHQLDVLARGAA